MAVTENNYVGDGSTVLFSLTFPYLEQTDVNVLLDGTPTTAFSFASDTQIQMDTAPANGVAVRIYRATNIDDLEVIFSPGSSIRAQDLNDNFDQNIYAAQEVQNYSVQDIGNVTLTGNYTFAGTVSVPTPTDASHAATKAYADNLAIQDGNVVPGDKGDITVSPDLQTWTVNPDFDFNTLAVGVGTGWSTLSVQSNGTAGDPATANQLGVGLSPTYQMAFGYYQSAVGQPFAGVIQTYDNGNPSYTTINPLGGNIGIGSATPAAPLDIVLESNQRLLFRERSTGYSVIDSVNAANSSFQGLVLNGSLLSFQVQSTEQLGITSGTATFNVDVQLEAGTRYTQDVGYPAGTPSMTFDLSTSNVFGLVPINGALTWTFANPAASGYCTTFSIFCDYSSGSITYPGGVIWKGGTAPTLAVGKCIFTFTTIDGGTTWFGLVNQEFS